MTYPSLMVYLRPGRVNADLLLRAGDLAERFDAAVVGLAAPAPVPMAYADGYAAADLYQQSCAAVAEQLAAAEDEFRTTLGSRVARLEWRSLARDVGGTHALADAARGADLLLVGDSVEAGWRSVIGDLVMRAGRPVLVVPARATGAPATPTAPLERVVVGWSDSRESRRAVVDALPLLRAATHVAVVAVAPATRMAEARNALADVAHWLARHGVAAESIALPASGDDAADLSAAARDQRADLVVAGAYGHSRLREWAFGGVTRSLLTNSDRCVLLSH